MKTKMKLRVASAELTWTNDAGEQVAAGRVTEFEYEGESNSNTVVEGLAMLTSQLEQNTLADLRRRRGGAE